MRSTSSFCAAMSTTRTQEDGGISRDIADREASIVAALSVITAARVEDFDGHTEFNRLRPAERLAWMESVVCLIESRRKTEHYSER